MKIEAFRERKLPAFSLSVDDLETLWPRLASRFEALGQVDSSRSSIELRFPKQTLTFDSPAELRNQPLLPVKATDFSIYFGRLDSSVHIRTDTFGGRATIRSRSDDEGWCAGSVEVVAEFIAAHKLWYWWLSLPVFFFGYCLLLVSYLIPRILFQPRHLPVLLLTGWALLLCTFGFIWTFYGKLFPNAVIRLSERENFIRRYSAELTVGLAAITFIATVVGFFLKR